jgi:fructose-1,6-bisphosphatase
MSAVPQTVDQPLPVRSSIDDGLARDFELATLEPLAREIPNIDSAVAEIARLSAELTLPKGTIHVISDIHGEDKKLRHVINNASGTLRPLVERLFKDQMSPDQFQEILTLIFYPAEVIERLQQTLREPQEQKGYAMRTLRDLFHIVRVLAARRSLDAATRNTVNCLLRSSTHPRQNGTRLTSKQSWINWFDAVECFT